MKRYVLSSALDPEDEKNPTLHKQFVGSTKTMFVFGDSVSFKYSTKYTGLNKHSKKQWYRWEDGQSTSIKKNAAGTPPAPGAQPENGTDKKPAGS